MSTGLECELYEIHPLGVFYMLQDPGCPAQTWDWREHEPAVGGPFDSEDAAFAALRRKHANPGGYSTGRRHLASALADPILSDMIECAMHDRPALTAPEDGEEIAWDAIPGSTWLDLDLGGWHKTTTLEDGRVRTTHFRDRLDEEVVGSVEVSLTWHARGLEAKITSHGDVTLGLIDHHVAQLEAFRKKVFPDLALALSRVDG